MQRIFLFCRTFWHETEGVTAIEYALLASLIAMVIVSAVATVGSTLQELWTKISDCVANPASCT